MQIRKFVKLEGMAPCFQIPGVNCNLYSVHLTRYCVGGLPEKLLRWPSHRVVRLQSI